MNDLQIFKNDEFGEVRTVTINNEPMFCLVDVCRVLDISNSRDAKTRLNKKGVVITDTLTKGGMQKSTFINEGNLYKVIFQSRKPNAEKFTEWVTDEVLPTIRKTGSYNLPTTYKDALKQLIIQVEENERLALENDEMKPKAEFFDTVAESKSAISMNEVAKVLDMGIGRNKLFEFLRENKVLDRWNVPYQRYIDNGWFRVIEQKYQKNGEPIVTTKTLVYQKGVDGIRKMYNKLALSYTE